ncbi:MAG: M81 family metallopeptidase [Pseudomonadota bacterium]|jgi:microcystin degradation protein MlrC|nr:M81 family metallopeptidase [Rubrivivax sp.]MCA3259589.1 M81 family metallopeptidase [Rubrivivax sp.]MCE2912051.1 M81 family metallopeptidase [Rubrivivax sp.]MCZ8030723.1 M81 family metallopeptidase [Rubrivivax sp.]
MPHMSRKAFVAALMHETNVFSPVPTNLASFDIWRPAGASEPPRDRDTMAYGEFWRHALAEGLDVAPGYFATCQPSAPLSSADWTALRDEMLSDLARAGSVDRVFLFLHGAQCAQGTDDVEGELLAAVRAHVGPRVPIAVVLDLHANVTRLMLEQADYLLACLEYPHTDYADRALEAYGLLERHVNTGLRPVTAAVRVPVVGAYPTTLEPMRSFVAGEREAQARRGVLSVSTCHGFWLSDVPDAIATVLAITDGDPALAETVALELACRFASAAAPSGHGPGAADAVKSALRLAAETGKPSVIADRCDNPGGGAAGDSTFVLSELIACGADGMALAMVWDPMVVDFAHRAGAGARLALRIGGKVGPCSGAPLDVVADVMVVRDDARQAVFAQGEPRLPLGRTARLRIGGVEVIANTERQQVFDPRVFTAHGIDPSACRVLVVKSTTHFRNGFAPLAGAIIDCETPGSVTTDPTLLGHRRLPRPLAPIDPGTPLTPRPLGVFSRAR